MKIPIVNENDEIISYKERDDSNSKDIRRIIGLYVFNENNELLIAKRQLSKKIDPNLWGASVAGTVDEGYDYDATVLKEAEEEIGLINIKPIFFKKYFYETYNAKRFSSVYYVKINSNEVKFTLQKEEVSEIKWISLEDLEVWFQDKPYEFIPSFKNVINNVKEINENKN